MKEFVGCEMHERFAVFVAIDERGSRLVDVYQESSVSMAGPGRASSECVVRQSMSSSENGSAR